MDLINKRIQGRPSPTVILLSSGISRSPPNPCIHPCTGLSFNLKNDTAGGGGNFPLRGDR